MKIFPRFPKHDVAIPDLHLLRRPGMYLGFWGMDAVSGEIFWRIHPSSYVTSPWFRFTLVINPNILGRSQGGMAKSPGTALKSGAAWSIACPMTARPRK